MVSMFSTRIVDAISMEMLDTISTSIVEASANDVDLGSLEGETSVGTLETVSMIAGRTCDFPKSDGMQVSGARPR